MLTSNPLGSLNGHGCTSRSMCVLGQRQLRPHHQWQVYKCCTLGSWQAPGALLLGEGCLHRYCGSGELRELLPEQSLGCWSGGCEMICFSHLSVSMLAKTQTRGYWAFSPHSPVTMVPFHLGYNIIFKRSHSTGTISLGLQLSRSTGKLTLLKQLL